MVLGTLAGGLGCFPFDHEGYPPRSHSRGRRIGIRSLVEGGRLVAPSFHPVLYPRYAASRGYPYRYFGEIQISLSLIRLLLLPTAHPLTFQR